MPSPRLVNSISAHCWNADGTFLASCPNSSDIIVYRASEDGQLKWQCVLKEHTQLVSAIEWNKDGSFASCSHDSSAYVWRQDGDAWRPELVLTRLRLAALCLKWSPCGDIFAIGGSEKRICICTKGQGDSHWAAHLIRKCHSSSVTAVAWHPNGGILAATSTDGRCMLFNTRMQGGSGGSHGSFGAVLLDIQAGSGWGLALSWSPSGEQLAISSHGSALHLVSISEHTHDGSSHVGLRSQQLLSLGQLPLRCIAHLSETQLVGAGFDGEVYLFERAAGADWALASALVPAATLSVASDQPGKLSSAFKDKLALFKGHSAQEASSRGPQKSPERQAPHSNVIVDMHVFTSVDGRPTGKFSTAGWDGRVLLWHVDTGDAIKPLQ